MLVVRMQRTGRKGHTEFRVVVQESRKNPTSGKVIAHLGSYNPHTKTAILDKEKAAAFVNNGAQPSDRVALLLKAEGVKLPSWVKVSVEKKRAIKNVDKLRRNRPAEEVVEAAEPVAEEAPVEVAAE